MKFRKWFEAKHMGDFIHQQRGIWMIPFRNIKKDPTEGWYVHWEYEDVSDLAKMKPGDKVGDKNLHTVFSGNPDQHVMWTINYVDEDKGKIYLTPTQNNPFLSGVGAGGHKFGKHDYDVLSGDHETERVNQILDGWKKGHAFDIRDVAYVLLGTLQTHVGPNGAQGGWYASRDTGSNRGGQKGMDSKDIMVRDAHTLKNVFKMDVPKNALNGTMDPYHWDRFVGYETEALPGSEVEGEDFNNPQTMAKMALSHAQPQIKLRNVSALIDYYTGHTEYRKRASELSRNDDDRGYEDNLEKFRSGGYTKKELEPLLKKVAKEFVNIHVQNQNDLKHDPYYLAKEKLIILAKQQGWKDILKLYETAKDKDNRRYVFDAYEQDNDFASMWRMFNKEKDPENIAKFMSPIVKHNPDAFINWLYNNEGDLKRMVKKSGDAYNDYIADELRKNLAIAGSRASTKMKGWSKEKFDDVQNFLANL